MSLILAKGTTPAEYAERRRTQLLALGCSEAYCAELVAEICSHTIEGPVYGNGVEWLRPGEEARDRIALRDKEEAVANRPHRFI
jgi:hypothetical protein